MGARHIPICNTLRSNRGQLQPRGAQRRRIDHPRNRMPYKDRDPPNFPISSPFPGGWLVNEVYRSLTRGSMLILRSALSLRRDYVGPSLRGREKGNAAERRWGRGKGDRRSGRVHFRFVGEHARSGTDGVQVPAVSSFTADRERERIDK